MTSNPTIFQKAIAGSSDYDDQFRTLAGELTVERAYWELVIDDVTKACAVLRPIYDSSGGGDGFVSLEVAPSLAHDTDGTIEAARSLHERINLPNLMVKIPATAEGVGAIRQMVSEGRNINVTLIFSLLPVRRGHRGLPERARSRGSRAAAMPPRCTAWRRSS